MLSDRVVISRLLRQARPYWRPICIGFIAILIGSAIDALIAWMIKPLLDDWLVHHGQNPWLMALPLIIVAIFILRGVVRVISEYCMHYTGRHIMMVLRREIYGHMLAMPMAFFHKERGGELWSRIIYNVEQIGNMMTTVTVNFLRDATLTLALAFVLMSVSWQLTLVFLLTMPLIALVIRFFNHRLGHYSKKVQDEMSDVSQSLQEMFRAQALIRLMSAVGKEKQRFDEQTNRTRQAQMKTILSGALNTALVQLLLSFPFAVCIYFIMHKESMGITTGALIAVVMAMGRMLRPVKNLTSLNVDIQKGLVAARGMYELMDLPVEHDDGVHDAKKVKGAITFKQVSLNYDEVEVLKEIDFEIAPGACVAFVGYSGAGKSSLINLLPRFYEPSAGVIELDGRPISEYTLSSLRRQFSYVPQDVALFHGSVWDNLIYGCDEMPSQQAVEEVTMISGAHDFISSLPDQYQTVIGDNGVRLSGGQRQRLAIARALLRDAPILVFDEATSSLDSHTESNIIQALSMMHRSCTTLLVAHRLSTILHADEIIVLSEGKIVGRGTHETLLAEHSVYQELYEKYYQEQDHGDVH